MPKREPIRLGDNLWAVPSTKGLVAYVDSSFFEPSPEWKDGTCPSDKTWWASCSHNGVRIDGLATRHKGRYTLLHTALTGWDFVDHRDQNPLNDILSNLQPTRCGTDSNRSPYKGSSSPYKGVSINRRRGRWMAEIRVNSHKYHGSSLGLPSDYLSEVEAALVADRIIESLVPKDFQWLNRNNFPEVMEAYLEDKQ